MFGQRRQVDIKCLLPDHAQRACVHEQGSIGQPCVKSDHFALQAKMGQQARSLQRIARHENHFANVCLRQSEKHRACSPASAKHDGGFTHNRHICNRAIKATCVGVGCNQSARFIAKHSVDGPNRRTNVPWVIHKIQRRNLVGYGDIASAPIGIGCAGRKILLQIFRQHVMRPIFPRHAQKPQPVAVDQR